MDQINLKEIEKNAYISFFKDGLYEILIGYILLISVLSSTLRELGLSDIVRISIYVPLMFLGVFIVYFGKKNITIPRLGLVKFNTERKKNITKLRITVFTLVTISISIAVVAMTGNLNINTPMIVLMPAIMFLFFAASAYYQDYPRFLIIGLLVASSELIYVFIESKGIFLGRGVLAYGIPGSIILIIGIYSLYNFIHKYPKPELEGTHVNNN